MPLQMLDWDGRRFPLLTDADNKPVLVAVDRRLLGRALLPHALEGRPQWGDEEAVIRDHFDAMLERLSSFEIMIAEGLIEEADLKPYLNYWMSLIGNPSKRSAPSVIHILWLYIRTYEFLLVPKLAARFDYTLTVPNGFEHLLVEQCHEGMWSPGSSDGACAGDDGSVPIGTHGPEPGKH